MFPNPCHDVLYIESNQDIAAIQLFSIDGKIQLQKTSINAMDCSADVSQLKSSLYLLKIRFANGEVQNTKLMID